MIDIEAIVQIANNVNEAKEAADIARQDRADIAEELITITLNEEEEVSEELRDRLRHVEHEIDLAEETIEASKNMIIAMIEEDSEELV